MFPKAGTALLFFPSPVVFPKGCFSYRNNLIYFCYARSPLHENAKVQPRQVHSCQRMDTELCYCSYHISSRIDNSLIICGIFFLILDHPKRIPSKKESITQPAQYVNFNAGNKEGRSLF